MGFEDAARSDDTNVGLSPAVFGLGGGLPDGMQITPGEESLGLGTVTFGRPRLSVEEKRRSVGVSLPPGIIAKLDSIAARSGRNRSEVIEYIVGEWDKDSWALGLATGIPRGAAPQQVSAHALAAITGRNSPSAGASAVIGPPEKQSAKRSETEADQINTLIGAIIVGAISSWTRPGQDPSEVASAIQTFTKATLEAFHGTKIEEE